MCISRNTVLESSGRGGVCGKGFVTGWVLVRRRGTTGVGHRITIYNGRGKPVQDRKEKGELPFPFTGELKTGLFILVLTLRFNFSG